ncbi:UDP-N-acetylglucosamine-transferase [bacterium]|nr:UDP-N-acetylglucosamine-transferase [bacterium]
MARKPETIFVQIASYRDPQLLLTIDDMLEKAKNPENLSIAITWQHSPEDEWDNLDKYSEDSRFKIIDTPHEESQGACWARNLLQQLYDGETYTLQIDSHTRFIENWDTELKKEYKRLVKKGIKKPLITSYAPSFEPDNDPESRIQKPWRMDFDRFSPDGNVHFLPSTVDDADERTEPIPARFYSAHFAFAKGDFVKEVPHDPDYYFHGEEVSIAVRAFTHGYDLLHPHKIFLWHYYTRRGLKKHWDDHTKWGERNDGSHKRNRKLLSMDGEVYDPEFFGIYGLGTERTLEDYERYAGLSFSRRAVQQHTIDKKDAPCPLFESEEEYQNSYSIPFKHCIDIHFDSVPHDDYDIWVVAFEDEDGNELRRDDAKPDEIKRLMVDPDRFCRLWRSFNTVARPYKWIVWPHSIKEGWVNRMEGILYEKK